MSARRSVIPVFVPHLGCPHTCVFCSQRRVTGSERPVTPKEVAETVLQGLQKVGEGAELAFYGGSFTAIPASRQEELLNASQPFIQSGAISGLRLSTRPDCIDEETLNRLRKYGVKTVELGVQSMCPDVLRLAERGCTPEDAERAAALVRQWGFQLILQMMTGLPGDTPERSMYTAEKLVAMKPNGVRIYPTVILKDTVLYDMWQTGQYKEHTVEDAVELGASLLELFEREHIAVIRFGLNPTDSLSAGGAVGGAYHPALGELALSRRYLRAEERVLSGITPGANVTLAVSTGRVSAAVGQRRENIRRLTERLKLGKIKIVERSLAEGELVRLEMVQG